MGNHWIEQPLPAPEVERIGPFLLVHHWQRGLPGGQNQLEVGVGLQLGFSSVTCIHAGAVRHRDSRGNDHVVRAGGTQWMDSGAGIVHSERPDVRLVEEGGWDITLVQGEWNGHASRSMDRLPRARRCWSWTVHRPMTPCGFGVTSLLVCCS